MKLKNGLVLVALTGAVLAATAQGIGGYGPEGVNAVAAPFGLVQQAWRAGGAWVNTLTTGGAPEHNALLLAGLALLATIIRRSVRTHK
jgi:hypothetical protein